jgi:hypothetical protein
MSDANNNFHELKKLLKLKRHEVPPPGYFNSFSDSVVSRIRAGDGGVQANFFERFQENSPFLATLLGIFHAKPGIVGALATCACLVLLFAVVVTDRSEPASEGMPSGFAQSMQPVGSAPGANSTLASSGPLAPPVGGGITVSSNPVVSLQPVATLFGAQQNPLFQPVGFVPAGQ